MAETTTLAPIVVPVRAGVVTVRGEDRLGFLDAIVSQRLDGVAAGTVRGALVLDQHGAPVAMFDVAVLADRLVLVLPEGVSAEELASMLGARTFLADARFEAGEVDACHLRGAGAGDVAIAAGYPVGPGEVVEAGGEAIVGRDGGIDVLALGEEGASGAVERLRAAGAAAAGPEALEAWRVAAGLPAWGREVAPPHLPEELGLLPGYVHLAKGCYPGQEAVARMWMLGRPRRRLAAVEIDGAVAPGWSHGSGRDRVEVTSTARDEGPTHGPTHGPTYGLAFVPSGASPGDRFGDDQGAVTVRWIVGADQPVPGHDPAIARRRDRHDRHA